MAFSALEEKYKKVQEDNNELMARWLDLKLKQADQMNAENDMFQRSAVYLFWSHDFQQIELCLLLYFSHITLTVHIFMSFLGFTRVRIYQPFSKAFFVFLLQGLAWLIGKVFGHNPGVLGSSRTGSSGFFCGSVLGKDTSEPSLVLVKPRKDMNNVSCRDDND